MGKLAAKITALMRDDELDALLRDHYRGEAQTLTSGAEENLLKLAHLLGSPTPEESERWRTICDGFVRGRKLGGEGSDGHTRIAASLLDVAGAVKDLHLNPPMTEGMKMAEALLQLSITYRKILMPLVSATERRLELDQSLHEQVERLAGDLRRDEEGESEWVKGQKARPDL